MTPSASLTFRSQWLFELYYDVHTVFDLIRAYSFYVQRLFYLLQLFKYAAKRDAEPKEKHGPSSVDI